MSIEGEIISVVGIFVGNRFNNFTFGISIGKECGIAEVSYSGFCTLFRRIMKIPLFEWRSAM